MLFSCNPPKQAETSNSNMSYVNTGTHLKAYAIKLHLEIIIKL